MKYDALEVSASFPVSARALYEAWLDADAHGAMTGSPATSEPVPGGAFTAWEGYIEGRHTALEPHRRIVQAWRSGDFPEGAEDSVLEVHFHEADGVTTVTIRHHHIPAGQGPGYEQGWEDFYFAPMRAHFRG